MFDEGRPVPKSPVPRLNIKTRKPREKVGSHAAYVIVVKHAHRTGRYFVDQQDVRRRNAAMARAYPRLQLFGVLINRRKSAYMAPLGVVERSQQRELIKMIGKGCDDRGCDDHDVNNGAITMTRALS